jgi:cell shape-determining protein MreD
MIKIITTIIVSILLALGEVSLLWSLPYPMNLATTVLPVLIFLIITQKRQTAWIFIITAGLIFDVFSFVPLGLNVALMAILYLLGRMLFLNYLANRTFTSIFFLTIALIAPFEIFNHLVEAMSGGLAYLVNLNELSIIGISALINLGFILTIYWLLRIIMRMFKIKIFAYERI